MNNSDCIFGTKYAGPRTKVLCGKVSESVSDRVRELIKSGQFGTINDFVEEAILEKILRIEWDKAKSVGE